MRAFQRGEPMDWLLNAFMACLNPDPPQFLVWYGQDSRLSYVFDFEGHPIGLQMRYFRAREPEHEPTNGCVYRSPGVYVQEPPPPPEMRRLDWMIWGLRWMMLVDVRHDAVVKGFRGDRTLAVQDLTMVRLLSPPLKS